ncbi:DUF998 domain-containing protein [Allokutzneria sp. A3M-2-11 16]|uniref:DUF998 domain-containing protein n=1 Tax=Allokutzneria sp. A3M-2-11 16 TaxID=2962043 RepID=UPI0020B7FA8B|nr:DUF998 domain-containing protein [Allokutzneria sp. A3M-2-11 16]MCP3800822.1 DUF998 domain-containing protein [Allokutzneria sp. A3M-2-11 16]
MLTPELTPAATGHHGAVARALAVGGTVAVLTTVAIIAVLDLVPAIGMINPVRRTISEHALGPNRMLFDLALLLLAAGSLAILAALVRGGLVRFRSVGAVMLGLWSAGLTVVVLFPKHNWAIGPSLSGDIHRVGSLVAFLSLPVAVLLIARRWLRDERWSGHARRARALGVLAVLSFAPIVYVLVYASAVGGAWWQVLPLGVIERVLALCEVVAVIGVGGWAIASTRPAAR